MIQEWFNQGCDYKKGVEIYALLPHNKNLLRLFRLRETKYNAEKLKYELKKHLHVALKNTAVHKENVPVETKGKMPSKPYNSKPIAYYPQELHEIFQRKNHSFYEVCSKKMKLNSIPEDDTQAALKLQIEIFKLWQTNDRCSEILHYYEETKRILPWKTERDFSTLTPQQLVNERQRLYSAVSKRKKTLEALQKEYKAAAPGKRKKQLFERLNSKLEEIQEKILQIEQLSKLINS